MKCPYMDDFSNMNTFMRFKKSAVDLDCKEWHAPVLGPNAERACGGPQTSLVNEVQPRGCIFETGNSFATQSNVNSNVVKMEITRLFWCWCYQESQQTTRVRNGLFLLCLSISLSTHWSRGNMAAILQMTFANLFSFMKAVEFLLNFHWDFFQGHQSTI